MNSPNAYTRLKEREFTYTVNIQFERQHQSTEWFPLLTVCALEVILGLIDIRDML